MAAISTATAFAWSLAALLLLGGAALTVVGRRGRRVDQTPFCRRCRYDLTGAGPSLLRFDAAQRCPECGQSIHALRQLIIGRRVPRRGLLAVGLAAALLGLGLTITLGVTRYRNFNWYNVAPSWWVLSQLGEADPAVVARAVNELAVRSAADRLSPEHSRRLIAFCLREQAAEKLRQPAIGPAAIDILGDLHARGLLSPTDRSQFLSQINFVRLELRGRIKAGDRTQVFVRHEPRGPSKGLFARGLIESLMVDEEVVSEQVGSWETGGTAGSGGIYDELPALPTGAHRISCQLRLRLFSGGTPGGVSFRAGAAADDGLKPIFEQTRTVSAELEVLPADAPDFITLVISPELDEAVKGVLSVRRVRYGNGQLHATLVVNGRPPVDLAVTPYVEIDGELFALSAMKFRKASSGGGRHERGVGGRVPVDPGSAATIILRGTREAAVLSPDLDEVWGGELRIENVPVER